MGDLVTDGPTATVKLNVNMMTDISHPLTFPVITTTMCVGAKCFSFWCFLSRENGIMPNSNGCCWGLESVPHPDLYPGHSWQSLYTLKGISLLFSLGGQLQQKSIFVDDSRSTDSWEPMALYQHCLLLGI